MSKRRAEKQLAREDLDRFDEDEEEVIPVSSTPTTATAEVLAGRKIAKARRSFPASAGSGKPSIFAGIQLTPTPSPFTSSATPQPTFGSVTLPRTTLTSNMNGLSSAPVNGTSDDDRGPEFSASVRRLNQAFVSHLQSLIAKDVVVDFRDNCSEYLKFFNNLETKYPIKSSSSLSCSKGSGQLSAPFKIPELKTNTPSLKFGPSTEEVKSSGSSNSTNTPFSGFTGLPSFGTSTPLFGGTSSSTPFSTSNISFQPASTLAATPAPNKAEGDDDGEEYVPPKNEDVKVDEEGSLFSKKVRLFYIKEGKYEVLGKGMLHIKKLETGKHQLIVRGENAIGSILLNILLVDGLPVKQLTKDVQIVAVTKNPATPKEETPTSVTFLLRCASESDASDLVAHITKFKEE